MKPVLLRRLRPEDAEAYVALRREALAQDPLAFAASPEDDFAGSVERVRAALADPSQATFGALAPALVGGIGIQRDRHRKASHKARIWGLYASPRQRGAGLGRSLLEAAVGFAHRLEGVTHIHLSVSDTSTAALRLYERAGFRCWGIEPDSLRVGSRSAAEHHLVLPLAAHGRSRSEEVEVTAIDHVYFAVRDLGRSQAFYDPVMAVLGFRKVARPLAGGDLHVHYFNRALQLTLRPARPGAHDHDPYAPGLHHLCLRVPDRAAVDRAARELGRRGIEATAPREYPEYHEDYYATFLRDPDGLRLEVVNHLAVRRATVEHWASFPPIDAPAAEEPG